MNETPDGIESFKNKNEHQFLEKNKQRLTKPTGNEVLNLILKNEIDAKNHDAIFDQKVTKSPKLNDIGINSNKKGVDPVLKVVEVADAAKFIISKNNKEANSFKIQPQKLIISSQSLFSDIIDAAELKNEQAEVNNTEILQRYRKNTAKFIEQEALYGNDLIFFLNEVDQNDKKLFELFDLINNEFQQDLTDCQEDLKILDRELQLWQLAGISSDVKRTHSRMCAAVSWMNNKKHQVKYSMDYLNSTTSTIQNSIDCFYQNKDKDPELK
ncbi:hypothetical protein QEN19_004416 [Hanseniaspora menglaensis]